MKIKPKTLMIFLAVILLVGITSFIVIKNNVFQSEERYPLVFIPTVIKYKNQEYSVLAVGISGIEKKIGITDKFNFEVFKITGVSVDNSIAILVHEKPKIYFKAIKGNLESKY